MRYVVNIFISFIIFNIIWIFIVLLQIGNPTKTSEWAHELYEVKEQYARSINGQKIVFVSGSNSLFGINSKMLEEQWGIPVVNYGVHAGLGMPYILYKSQSILQEGDIAILPFEYPFYIMDDMPSEANCDHILSRDPKYFYSLSKLNQLKVIFSIGFKRLLSGFKFYIYPIEKIKGFNGTQNINLNGDQMNIDYEDRREKDLDSIKADKIKTTDLSSEFIENLNTYISWAKKKKITLIFMPPTHMYFNIYDSNEYKIFLNNIKDYYKNRNVLYIGTPKEYMYEKQYYFNTSYHLNNIGVEKRTKQLIKDINQSIYENLTQISK